MTVEMNGNLPRNGSPQANGVNNNESTSQRSMIITINSKNI